MNLENWISKIETDLESQFNALQLKNDDEMIKFIKFLLLKLMYLRENPKPHSNYSKAHYIVSSKYIHIIKHKR